MTESTMTIDDEGTEHWRNEKGELHRLDGPALVYAHGSEIWYQNHKIHRTGGPSVKYSNGTKMWHQNNELHRVDGPAIEWADGVNDWCFKGKRFGSGIEAFWAFWDCLDEEERQNVNLHMWLARLQNV